MKERGKSWLKLNIQKTKIMASGPSLHVKEGKIETVANFILLGWKITMDSDCNHKMKRWLLLDRKAMAKLGSVLKGWNNFADKGPSNQSYGFSSSHVQIWELGHKKEWGLKNRCFQTVVLEKILESLGMQVDQTSQF